MNTLKWPNDQKQRTQQAYRLFRNLTIVSGCFSALVCLILGFSFWQFSRLDPINSAQMPELIQQAQQGNSDPDFLASVRAYDLMIRRAHFTALAFHQYGAYLLLGGLSLFLLFLKVAYELSRKLPAPGKYIEREENPAKIRRIQIALLGFAGVLIGLAFLLPRLFSAPWMVPDTGAQAGLALPLPSQEVARAQWPAFRGFQGLGLALDQQPPIAWDAATGQNILWKSKIPKPGYNSPIVWENRVFLSGADAQSRDVYCFDFESGELLWQTSTTAKASVTIPKVTDDTGLAASSLATDGRVVSAIFATGELLSVDFSGNIQWEKKLAAPENHYGHSSSLLTFQDLLLVQIDDNRQAKVMAYDTLTGKLRWQKKRPTEISWASPIIAPASTGEQLILTSTPLITAFQPSKGKLLWQLEEVVGGEIGPSPAFSDDRLFFINQYSQLACVDILQPQVLWTYDRNLSDIPSPVADSGLLIVPTSFGTVSCLDAQTGNRHWEQRFTEGFQASPIVSNGLVYLLDKSGTMRIFRLADAYTAMASPRIAEACSATPAFAQNRIIIRGAEHLYCVGNSQP